MAHGPGGVWSDSLSGLGRVSWLMVQEEFGQVAHGLEEASFIPDPSACKEKDIHDSYYVSGQ